MRIQSGFAIFQWITCDIITFWFNIHLIIKLFSFSTIFLREDFCLQNVFYFNSISPALVKQVIPFSLKHFLPFVSIILYFLGFPRFSLKVLLMILCYSFTSQPLIAPSLELPSKMAAHSSILAWKIPWMEESARLQSMGSQRVGHD